MDHSQQHEARPSLAWTLFSVTGALFLGLLAIAHPESGARLMHLLDQLPAVAAAKREQHAAAAAAWQRRADQALRRGAAINTVVVAAVPAPAAVARDEESVDSAVALNDPARSAAPSLTTLAEDAIEVEDDECALEEPAAAAPPPPLTPPPTFASLGRARSPPITPPSAPPSRRASGTPLTLDTARRPSWAAPRAFSSPPPGLPRIPLSPAGRPTATISPPAAVSPERRRSGCPAVPVPRTLPLADAMAAVVEPHFAVDSAVATSPRYDRSPTATPTSPARSSSPIALFRAALPPRKPSPSTSPRAHLVQRITFAPPPSATPRRPASPEATNLNLAGNISKLMASSRTLRAFSGIMRQSPTRERHPPHATVHTSVVAPNGRTVVVASVSAQGGRSIAWNAGVLGDSATGGGGVE
ncbi:hypothetical protein H9P43_000249 [Blastocladiella emersonii ATCC 22665]|nr:hypothetical protein H9P43_000249 [Blastocladiella emersonii ATCC 22665]